MSKQAATTPSRHELEWRDRLTRYSMSGQTVSGGFGWLDRIYSFLSDELRLFSWLLMPLV